MKTICISLFLTIGIFAFKTAHAQANININLGAQPVWGPVGYDYVDYYYFPDAEVYYYVPKHQYVYRSGKKWVFVRTLPASYSYFNPYTGYKVVINQPRAYMYFDKHKVDYVKFKGQKQVIIKESDDPKYYVVKGHPKYKSAGNNGNGNGGQKAKPSHNSKGGGGKGKGGKGGKGH